ncbi:MAG: hypothetical protein HY912_13390 [Desulfomonile tiedjei]|uniref:Glutaredoxin domain-containing protein n=1 Tax=Desulfomonile tiedjei TaxID=2358 RepID=A0A9D6V5S7_9BACT|nr:hypothetical protein [Desulfomonile tiedjei]
MLWRLSRILIVVASFMILLAADVEPSGKKGNKGVGMVFFSSRDCPKCETIKDLIGILKVRYPLRVRQFDISKEADYAVFKTVESIHGSGNFAVPLVMIGESILIGELEIAGKLEKTVRGLDAAGGSRSPYIGHVDPKFKARSADKTNEPCESCSRDGKPPQVGDELRRVRGFLDKLF